MTTYDEQCADETDVDTFPTSISDLQLPSSAHNFSSTLSSLKRATLSTYNRLRSIQHDSIFVQAVASRHNLPLIANERCGSWYIPPGKKAGSAYFKSTDGHFGKWGFSLRRLNLQMLEVIGLAGGFVKFEQARPWKSAEGIAIIVASLSTPPGGERACLMPSVKPCRFGVLC